MAFRKVCKMPSCENYRFLDLDYCLRHAPDAAELEKRSLETLLETNPVLELSLPGMRVEATELTGKTFLNCDFTKGVFKNCLFDSCSLSLCFFDSCVFDSCRFVNVKALESVFALAHFTNCKIEESDIIQCNFNKARLDSCEILANDFMYSRFLALEGDDILFEDCNVKGVYFSSETVERISFKYSNKEDIIIA